MIITIDGPSASGKSTIARMLAYHFGYYYVCSGFLYRALAYLLINKHKYTLFQMGTIKSDDIADCFDPEKFVYHYDAQLQEHVFFENEDITPYLKDSLIDKATSIISVNESVRHVVTILQRSFATKYSLVIDGRDVGTVVFPDAHIKFFLTASVDVRAQRWLSDQKKRGHDYSLQQAIEKIVDRDQRDRERALAPLRVPEDAFIVDNSTLDIAGTFSVMAQHITEKLGIDDRNASL